MFITEIDQTAETRVSSGGWIYPNRRWENPKKNVATFAKPSRPLREASFPLPLIFSTEKSTPLTPRFMGPRRTNELMVRTPEGVVFRLRLADPVSRFLALAIDQSCVLIASSLLSNTLLLTAMASLDLAIAAQIIGYFALTILYFIIFEWRGRGQTIGKRVMKLRVADAEGFQVDASQIVIRNLLRFVDLLPGLYGIGLISCLISKKFQRLGDIAANTVVIRTQSEPIPDLEPLLGRDHNSLRNSPHLASRLRQLIDTADATLALAAILRRDELAPQPRIEVFRELAAYFREMLPFPEEDTIGLSDEQYVRNIVDIVYRPRP